MKLCRLTLFTLRNRTYSQWPIIHFQQTNNNKHQLNQYTKNYPSSTALFKTLCSTNMSAVTNIDFDTFKTLTKDNSVLIVDVREPDELKDTGVIPGSINIPVGTVEDTFKNIPDDKFKALYGRDKPAKGTALVFSCRSGKRSLAASEVAVKLGYSNVSNYTGGWLDWEKNIGQ